MTIAFVPYTKFIIDRCLLIKFIVTSNIIVITECNDPSIIKSLSFLISGKLALSFVSYNNILKSTGIYCIADNLI